MNEATCSGVRPDYNIDTPLHNIDTPQHTIDTPLHIFCQMPHSRETQGTRRQEVTERQLEAGKTSVTAFNEAPY